jgi:RNA polymerase sigma factor (sigma-70 family)
MQDDNDQLREQIDLLYRSLNAYARACLQNFPSYMREHVEDCVQEALAEYCERRDGLKPDINHGGWAARALLNKMRELNRKLKSERKHMEHTLDHEAMHGKIADEQADVESRALISDEMERVHQIVGDEKFELMKKAYGEEIPQKQLAMEYQKSESNLRSILFRAKEKVKKEWE